MRIALLFMLVSLCSCQGYLSGHSVYSSKSPDGKANLQVTLSGCCGNYAVKVNLERGSGTEGIAVKSDCWFEFAHAHWNGKKVAIFVDGVVCGSIKTAFDTESGRELEFQTMEDQLRESIVKSYGVSPEELNSFGGDVFAWATYQGDGVARRSQLEFRKRFPQNY
jgi:hypothetical protein